MVDIYMNFKKFLKTLKKVENYIIVPLIYVLAICIAIMVIILFILLGWGFFHIIFESI